MGCVESCCGAVNRRRRGSNQIVPLTSIRNIVTKKYLILLACDKYKHMDNLYACVNDAKLIKQTLISQYIVLCELYDDELTLMNFLSMLQQIKSTITSYSKLVFFFAGHGILDDDSGRSFLCFHDTHKNNLLVNAFDMHFLRLYCDHIASKKQLYIIDSCHSAFVMRARGSKYSVKRSLPAIKCLCSSQSHQSAIEMGKNSLFTRHLVSSIQVGLTSTDIFCRVRQKMLESNIDQVPVLGNLVMCHRGESCTDGDIIVLD